MPDPRTAMVRPPDASALSWAQASTPRAAPLTTVAPAAASAATRAPAISVPAAEQFLAPTTATRHSGPPTGEPLLASRARSDGRRSRDPAREPFDARFLAFTPRPPPPPASRAFGARAPPQCEAARRGRIARGPRRSVLP